MPDFQHQGQSWENHTWEKITLETKLEVEALIHLADHYLRWPLAFSGTCEICDSAVSPTFFMVSQP